MKKLFIVLFALMAGMTWAQQSPVTAGSDGKSWTLATRSFIYQIRVSDQGKVNMFYFGDKSQNPDMLRNPLGEEITVRGGYSATTPMLEAVFKDRVRDIELTYEGSEMLTQDGYATLVIRQKDNYYPLAVTEYIRVLPEYDLLEKWVEIKNTGKKGNIEIENAQSGTFFLPKNAYELTHLSGRWGYEYQMNVTKLTQGLKTIQTKDLRSYGSSFFAIRPEGEQEETCGEVWFGSLQYSGNWRMDFEKYAPGATGTQASFLELFDGDHAKCRKVDQMIAEKMGFDGCYPVSGQTYSRKQDTRVLNVLAGIAQSAHKFSNDIRLLQHLKEVEEPFEKNQIGSSAMAYKRNPMRSERMASLANYVMADVMNPMLVASTQWFERTLDDSANKRLSVPEGFLAIDGILDLYLNVVDGLVVYPKVIEKHMMAELPFMATENIMMDAVKAGGDRQELHEKIRTLSMEAGKNVKGKGLDNNLLELIAADPAFNLSLDDLKAAMKPERYTGRAKEQVDEFLAEVIQPILDANKEDLGVKAEINV